MRYKVSVIIPCYNSEETVKDALESAISQGKNLSPIEIICVDDGSTDGTWGILSEYAERYQIIKTLTQENRGAGYARNAGIEVADGEFVCFLDADDTYPRPDTLATLYHAITESRQRIVGGSFSVIHGRNGKVKDKFVFPLDGYTFTERTVMRYSDYQFDYGYHRFIYDLEFLRANNITFPSYRRYQDPPFFARAMLSAETFMAIPEQTYRYRMEHKTVCWTEQKVADMMDGITEMLRLSKKENLPKLHFYTYVRLVEHFDLIAEQICIQNSAIRHRFIELINEVDFDFIRNADNYYEVLLGKIPHADMLRNLELFDGASAKKVIQMLEIGTALMLRKQNEDIKRSWTYRIERIIVFLPKLVRNWLRGLR